VNSIELANPSCKEQRVTAETKLAVQISVNGDAVTTKAATLADLLAELELTGRIATARNGDFVPERARAATRLERGDRIEIVSPRHGG
jgi:sulfur carrier protein